MKFISVAHCDCTCQHILCVVLNIGFRLIFQFNMTCLFYVLRYILEIWNTLNKGHYQFFVNWDLFWLISRSSRDFPKCKVPSEYVYLHLNISFEKKIDWFTSTRGVYGCLRTCYALKLFNSRQAFMLCLKDQAVSSWFTFARGVYIIFISWCD